MDPLDRFAQQRRHGQLNQPEIPAVHVLDRVGRDQFFQRRGFQPLQTGRVQHRVTDSRVDFSRPVFFQHRGRAGQRPGRLGQVIDQDRVAAFHIAHYAQDLHLVSRFSFLGHDRQRRVEHVGVGVHGFYAADIRRDHDQVLQVFFLEIAHDHRRGVEMIDRDIEKPHQLLRVQIHRQHPVRSRRHDQVGNELGRDRDARLVLAVLAGIPEIRDHRRDPVRTRPPRRVDHDQQLHQMLVRRGGSRLDDEHVPTADVLVDLYKRLVVRERRHRGRPQGHFHIVGNPLRQSTVRIAGKNL